MKRILMALTATTIALLFTSSAGASEWKIDTGHSNVGFSVRHLGLSNVKGKFTKYDARVQANDTTGKIQQFLGTVQVASVDTGMDKRDAHLRAAAFFDAAKYPTMTIKTKSITWKGSTFTAVADLTIKNVTKQIVLTGEHLGHHKVNFGGGDEMRSGYSLTTTINRKDFGLSFNMLAEGVAIVADSVKIMLDMELSRTCDGACS